MAGLKVDDLGANSRVALASVIGCVNQLVLQQREGAGPCIRASQRRGVDRHAKRYVGRVDLVSGSALTRRPKG